jgi:2'-5' RNA ligase
MSYAIRRAKGKYEVYKEGDGQIMGRHDYRTEARDQMRALYRSEADKSWKAMSLDDKVSKIRQAIYEKFGEPGKISATPSDIWIEGVYEDFVIVNRGGKRYRITYTLIDTGDVETDGVMQQVEMEWKPVEGGKSRKVMMEGADESGGNWVAPDDKAAEERTGVVIALMLPEADAAALMQSSPESAHVTLVYLGDKADLTEDQRSAIEGVIEQVAGQFGPVTGDVNGIGRFIGTDEGKDAVYLNYDAPSLPAVRQALVDGLKEAGVQPIENHGFTPHITVAYIASDQETPQIDGLPRTAVTHDGLVLCWGDEHVTFPLEGKAEPIRKDPATVSTETPAGKNLNLSYAKSLGLTLPDNALAGLLAVKYIGKDTIHAYSNLWGDPERVDLEREFFTPDTDFWDEVIGLKSARPLTWDHAQDDATKADPVIGTITEMGNDKVGRWYTAQLRKNHTYRRAIDRLIEEGALGSSSDSAPQYVLREKAKSGAMWLKRWPLFATALTTTPCEPRMIGSVDYFKSIGLVLPPEAPVVQARELVQKAMRVFSYTTFGGM